jgi:hypothetical protein
MPKYRITFTAPKHILRKPETRSEIIEASNLEEAERTAILVRGRYFFQFGLPVSWTMSVEELAM